MLIVSMKQAKLYWSDYKKRKKEVDDATHLQF